jgi:hypothetical protein
VGALVTDHVIAIDRADRRGELLVQIAKLAGVEVLVRVGQRLVEEVVCGHRGLVPVAPRHCLPELDGEGAISVVGE